MKNFGMKLKSKKWIAIAALIFALMFAFGACGASSDAVAAPETQAAEPSSTPFDPGAELYKGEGEVVEAEAIVVDETPMATDEPASLWDSLAPEAAPADMSVQETADSIDSGTGGSAGTDTGFTDEDEVSDVQSGRKITFSADISIDTKSYDADYTKINDMITQAGGYVATENTSASPAYGADEGRHTYLSTRVPAEGYDSFLDTLSSVGEVTDKNKASQDLTTEYFDTEARIEMLELRKERLMNYLVLATDASEIIEFERELSDVLYELDQYQGNKRKIDQFVEFATVDITLTELITPETIGKDGQPLGDRANDAFELSKNGVGTFLADTAVFFAGAAPVIALIVVIIVIILLIVWIVRKLNAAYRKRFPKKEKAPKPLTQRQIYQQQMYQQQVYQQQRAMESRNVPETEVRKNPEPEEQNESEAKEQNEVETDESKSGSEKL